MHVGSSRWCPTAFAMTGARGASSCFDGPLPRRAIARPPVGKPRGARVLRSQARPSRESRSRSGISLVSKTEQRSSILRRPAHVVLASRTANAGRKPKISGWKSRGPRPWRAAHLAVMAVSYAACGRFDSDARYEQRSVAKWHRARFGTARPWVRPPPLRRVCRAVHLGVIAVLQTACGRFDSDARYERSR